MRLFCLPARKRAFLLINLRKKRIYWQMRKNTITFRWLRKAHFFAGLTLAVGNTQPPNQIVCIHRTQLKSKTYLRDSILAYSFYTGPLRKPRGLVIINRFASPPWYKGRGSSALLKIAKCRKKPWIYRKVLNHRTT